MSRMFLAFMLSLCSFSFVQAKSIQTPSLSKEEIRKQVYEALPSCGAAVFTDENYLVSSLAPDIHGLAHIRLISLNDKTQTLDLPAPGPVVDLKIQNSRLYILTVTQLQAWDLATQKLLFTYATHPKAKTSSSWREQASGFILKDNKAIIAHGTLGISVVDLRSGIFLKLLPMPTLSSAQDIDLLNANTAILAVDNSDEATFRGMYLFDLENFEISKQIKIDNALPSAIRVLDQNRLMVIYFNAVWKFDLQTAISSPEPAPNRRAWKFPGIYIVDMKGKVAFDKKNLYACMHTTDEKTGVQNLVPMSFDLVTLKLN